MSDPSLILHKVRGEPAFDIATKIRCPVCAGQDLDGENAFDCSECEDGFWWIIPTSGHRAHPIWFCTLDDFVDYNQHLGIVYYGESDRENVRDLNSVPDHYPSRAASLIDLLTEISDKGWRINNLFQLDHGWRCNLRRQEIKGDWYTDFGDGLTPEQAVSMAIDKLDTAEYIEQRQQTYSKESTKIDIRSVISALAPKIDVDRRF